MVSEGTAVYLNTDICRRIHRLIGPQGLRETMDRFVGNQGFAQLSFQCEESGIRI